MTLTTTNVCYFCEGRGTNVEVYSGDQVGCTWTDYYRCSYCEGTGAWLPISIDFLAHRDFQTCWTCNGKGKIMLFRKCRSCNQSGHTNEATFYKVDDLKFKTQKEALDHYKFHKKYWTLIKTEKY